MTEVNFFYNGQNIIIQCNLYDVIYEIFQKLSMKTYIDLNSVCFLYNGKIIFNQYLTLDQIMNNDDKLRNKMNILIYDKNNTESSQTNINSELQKYNDSLEIYPLTQTNIIYSSNENIEYIVPSSYIENERNSAQNYSLINEIPSTSYDYTQNKQYNNYTNYTNSYGSNNIINIDNNISVNKDYNTILLNVNDSNKRIEEIEKEIKAETQKLKLKIEDMQKRLMRVNKLKIIKLNGIYNGEIQNGTLNGLGIFEGNDGNNYEGEWINNKRNGVGIYYYKSGKIYQGEFKGGKFHGYAIEEDLNGKYKGTYVDNCFSGRGIITLNSGNKYIGQFYKAKANGFGKQIWPDGSYFIGEYKNGIRYKGITFYSEERGLFDATWEFIEENGNVKGKGEGIYYLPNGKKEKRIRIIDKKGYWQYF